MSGPAVGIIHVHSSYSHDSRDTLERLRTFAVDLGIDFVGLTDHAEDFDPERFETYVRHCREVSDDAVTLVPGLEYRFDGFPGMHLLALALTRWIQPRTPGEFVAQAKTAATFSIAAHPRLAGYELPDVVVRGIDAIEVWNTSYDTRYLPDTRAIRLLQTLRRSRPELLGTVGLDQHDCRNDREARVLLNRRDGDPIAELKSGRFLNVGRTMRFDPTVSWNSSHVGLVSAARWVLDRVDSLQERRAGSPRASR
jgi:hypothetical protein